MKIRHLLSGTILTIFLLAASIITAFAGEPNGRFEKVDSSTITGWAYNSDSPDTALNVMVTVTSKTTGDPVFTKKVTAGDYRDKLYNENKGNGCHGFTINMDWSKYPNGDYLIQGGVGDSDFSNPMTYTNTKGQAAEAEKDAKAADAAANSPKLVPLGVFKTTAYCANEKSSGGWGRNTSTGAMATANHTIAVDPRVIPYGTKVMINGVVYTAEDCGGAVKGKHIDIFFNTYAETVQYGVQNAQVYLVQS